VVRLSNFFWVGEKRPKKKREGGKRIQLKEMWRDRKLAGQFAHTDNPHRHTGEFKNRIAGRVRQQPLENARCLSLRQTTPSL